MTKILLVAALGTVLLVPHAHADNGSGFGLGVMVGEPTGVSMKAWLGSESALDMGAAWSFESDSRFQFQMDYVVHKFSLIKVEKGSLPLYFGIGGRYRFRENHDDDLGVRVPVGLDYLFENSRFDVFVEVVPILNLVPSTDFDLNAALGGRFFF
jgi:hypothetical protein